MCHHHKLSRRSLSDGSCIEDVTARRVGSDHGPNPGYTLGVNMREMNSLQSSFTVVDLFSGAGGASYGFSVNPRFSLLGSADVELGKPSTGFGAIDCNGTYEANVGLRPHSVDLGAVVPANLQALMEVDEVDVLIACPPCTGFSRTVSRNHLIDDPRNSLVARCAEFVQAFQPKVFVLENARELLTGRFRHHWSMLKTRLAELNYQVDGSVHMLSRFGLPQQRERSIVVATRSDVRLRSLDELWSGYRVDEKATHVRRAIGDLPPLRSGEVDARDSAHTSTLSKGFSLERIRAIPVDGGSWVDLLGSEGKHKYVTPAMWTAVRTGHLNHFCDVYGRMSWDRPAPTIKRESAHPGNGRYLHPEQDRLCSVREMAVLQGFPQSYVFPARSRKNSYRHIGDAVPPLISYQLSKLAEWMLTDEKPAPEDLIMPNSHLNSSDVVEDSPLRLI